MGHHVRVNEFTSLNAFSVLCNAHAFIFSNEHSSNTPLLSAYILEALFLVHLITPYFAIIFGPMNISISSTENATIKLHAARAGYKVTSAHHHTRHLMPHKSYQCSWTLTRLDATPNTDQTADHEHIISLLQQQCGLQPTITDRRSLQNLPIDPVNPSIVATICFKNPIASRDTGQQIGPLSPTYNSATITPYDKWLIRDDKPFWIPTRAFARATGFPDSLHLYHNPSEATASLAHSTSPVTAAITIATAFLLIGINLFSSPTSPVLQVIMRAIPNQTVPDISLHNQLRIIGTSHELAQLILHTTHSQAAEIALTFVRQGITSLDTLAQKVAHLQRHLLTYPQLQDHISTILHRANIPLWYNAADNNQLRQSKLLPTHLHQTFLTLNHSQQSQFMHYISPLLSPLHALLEDVPQAYHAAISLHRNTSQQKEESILITALNIAAVQDTAAKIILFLIPPLIPIEILHRSLCIALLQNTAPRAFLTVRTARTVSRSLLGRF